MWNERQHDHDESSNRKLNRIKYCYFADKCFDKLWLKDCLIELCRAGMREREVYIL